MLFSRFFKRNRSLLIKLLLFLSPLVPLALVKAPDLPQLRVYDRLQSLVVHPTAELITNASQGASYVWDNYFSLVGKSKQNEELLREVEALESQLLEMSEFKSENERLRKMLIMSDIPTAQTVGAQIIGEDPSGESMSFFINAGLKQGVHPRMAVVAPSGVVGSITRSYSGYSLFTAIQDPSHTVDGMILRSRAQFIVEGRGASLTGRLKYLDRSADVRVGDLVVTSGLDGVFSKGLKIGYIIKVDRPRTGVTQNAELRPTADLSYLEEVRVVLDQKDIPQRAAIEDAAKKEGKTL